MVAEILDQILSYQFYLITKRQNLFFYIIFTQKKVQEKCICLVLIIVGAQVFIYNA